MNWPKARLGEVMRLAHEAHPVEPGRTYPNLGIYSFGRGVFAKPPIDAATTSATTLYKVKAGQLIYSRLFAFEGAYTTVPEEFDGAFVSNEFPTFSVRPDRALPGYLGWLFRWPETWRLLRLKSVGLGDRRQRIHPERLLEHEAPLPPLEEQKRIVARLDAAASALAKRRAAADAVAAEMSSTLRSAFARIVADAPRARMGDIAPLVRRAVTIDAEALYSEIGVRSFYRGLFTRRTVKGEEFDWQKLFEVRSGDLVFSNLMAWEQAIGLADTLHNGSVGNHRMLTCEVDSRRASPDFLFYYFTTEEGFRQIVGASPGTMVRNKTLSTRLLPGITVPTPSLDTQHWFDQLQAKCAAARAAQRNSEFELSRLLPAMLHDAFGG